MAFLVSVLGVLGVRSEARDRDCSVICAAKLRLFISYLDRLKIQNLTREGKGGLRGVCVVSRADLAVYPMCGRLFLYRHYLWSCKVDL
jgi:hypothetical protein